MEIAVHLMISMLTFFSLVVITFALFKIPLLEHHRMIATLSLLLGLIHFYTRFIMETQLFGLVGLSFFIVLLMIMKRYPVFYCLIVCGIGFLVVSAIDAVVTLPSIQFGLADRELIESSLPHFVIINIVATNLALIIAMLLRYFKLGFSFVIRRYTGNQMLKSYNFIWAGIIILSVAITQLSYLVIDESALHFYIFIAIVLGLYITLTVAYRQNKKSLQDRFGR